MRTRTLGVAAAIAAATTLLALSLVLAYAPATPGTTDTTPRPSARPPGRPKAVAPDPSPPRATPSVSAPEGPADRGSTTLPAIVEPAEEVQVVADVAGHIGRLAVDIGATVRRGDLLAEIDAPGLDFNLKKARVALQQAGARLVTAKAEVKVADTAVKTAQAELEASQATLRQAEATSSYRKRQYSRIAELVKKGALQNRIGEEEQARIRADDASVQAAGARVAIERAALLHAEAKLEAAVAEAAEAEEAHHLAELVHEEARSSLEARRVRSPIDGVVTRRHHHAGEAVRSGAAGGPDAIFTIVGMRTVRVVAQVPDREAPLVAVGDPATFRPEARPGAQYPGKVSRTAVAEDPATHTMRVEIDLDNDDFRLRPGQRGTLRIVLRGPEGIESGSRIPD